MMAKQDLQARINNILRELQLSPRCVQLMAYTESAALTFYVPRPTNADLQFIRQQLRLVCAEHNWEPPGIVMNSVSNTITASLQKSNRLFRNIGVPMPESIESENYQQLKAVQ